MRLFIHTIRYTTTLVISLCIAGFLSASPAMALTIASPTEGQQVRDRVAIIVPKSSLTQSEISSGYVDIKIDKRFVAAVSTADPASDGKAPASPNIVFMWESKVPFEDPTLPNGEGYYKEGKHEIVVEGHGLQGRKDTISGSATVSVVLQNQVPRPNPAPPVKLVYRYNLGRQSIYSFSIKGELLDNSRRGVSLTGGQPPIQGEFDVMQVVEDVPGDGTAMLRYKVQPDGFAQSFGQTNLFGQSGQVFKSTYKILDKTGRTVADNVLSTKNDVQVTDCLVKMPDRPVQVGESWQSTYKLKLEGMCDLTEFKMNSKLEALEFEHGLKCAKIVSKMTPVGQLKFTFGSPSSVDTAVFSSTAYFSYELGKLVKNVIIIKFGTMLDTAALQSLQQQTASGAVSSPAAMPGMGGIPAPPGGGALSTPIPVASSSSGGNSTSVRTAANVKVVITEELQK